MKSLRLKAYTEDDLQAALEDIRNGKLGISRAAREYNIPRRTLRDRIAKEDKKIKQAAVNASLDRAHLIGRIKEYNERLAMM